MKLNSVLEGIVAVALAACLFAPVLSVAQDASPSKWTYKGKEPEEWGKLDPAYAECGVGKEQSPIDLKSRKIKTADLPPLQVDYRQATLNIIDNGHTIEVNYPAGSTLTVGGKVYTVEQFHFHHPSEEHVNGKALPLEAHIAHRDAEGKLAVVAILFEVGAPNSLIDVLWKNIPAEKEKAVQVSAASITAADLLPVDRRYYTFKGSLTTPPCSEGVAWYVLKAHSSISKEQLDTFAKIYRKNARPIQPANGRQILQTK